VGDRSSLPQVAARGSGQNDAMSDPPAVGACTAPDEVAARVAEWHDDLRAALGALYGDRAEMLFDELVGRAATAAGSRRSELVELDRQRERRPDWYQHTGHVGYIAYADRFGGDLAGVRARIPYLTELGVDVLHLMAVLKPRDGENDGGYAVDDYRVPDPRLGTPDDLVSLADALRRSGVSLCLDLVMNHTSADHEWARAARAGSDYHRSLYRVFDDRTLPDEYERTLPEVFPTMAPGNFTWVDELDAWVWTTFREFQWDLDWSNPDVLLEMTDVMLHLAGLGVEIVRLDAVAFTWKRIGTNCQNQPEAHLIVQVLRAVLGIAAPAAVLLAEAIVGPDDLVAYLGRHELERRECELAYHNQLMVMGWSMLAEQRVALATEALARLPDPPSRTTWFTYVRCHDDIGWAVSDRDALAVGLDGWQHRAFLANWYRGEFPLSFARGTAFSSNERTGDERTCGMTATLCGIAAGRDTGDVDEIDRGVRRLLLLYAIAFGYGGIPMIYMGDELGQGDDDTCADDLLRAADSRWRHRPRFDDDAAMERHDAATVAGAVFAGLRRLAAARRSCPPLHGAGRVTPVPSRHEAVFAWLRRHDRYGAMLGLANVSIHAAHLPLRILEPLGQRTVVDVLAPDTGGLLRLEPFQVRWLTADTTFRPLPPTVSDTT
jgi:amylosucrase